MMVEFINKTTSVEVELFFNLCEICGSACFFCLLTVTHSRKSRTTLRRCGGSTGSPWSTSTMRDPLSFHHWSYWITCTVPSGGWSCGVASAATMEYTPETALVSLDCVLTLNTTCKRHFPPIFLRMPLFCQLFVKATYFLTTKS